MVSDILIIGGGAAAMTAALYASRAGYQVTLVEKNAFGGQIADSPKVENFPTIPSISGLELSNRMFEQISDLGTNIEMDEILSLQKKDGIFIIQGQFDSYFAKSVILATGVKHRALGIKGEKEFLGKGVSYCAVCDGAFYTGEKTMVIGDGNSALQYALMLAKTSSRVDVVTLFDRFFGDKVLVEALQAQKNVFVSHNLNSLEFYGEERLKGVLFEDTISKEQKRIETNGCFIAIGQVPDNERFQNLIDLEKGFIVTNDAMETKTPGLFAAGDCRVKKVRQLTTACNDGAIASLAAGTYLSSLKPNTL